MKKRIILIISIFLCIKIDYAQEIVFDFCHENGKYFNFHNLVETSDNGLIVECPMFEAAMVGPDIGVMFYKISSEGQITDSLLIENDNIRLRTLFETNPNNPDDHLFAYFDVNQDGIVFRMTFIDSHLNIIGTNDVLLDNSTHWNSYDCFMDSNGDIIASFSFTEDTAFRTFFVRLGFDGTLKFKKEIPEIRHFEQLQSSHTGEYCKSPLQYCYWGSNNTNDLGENPPIRNYVLDSLFNVVDEHGYYRYNNNFYGNGWQEHIVPLDDEHYLLTTRYSQYDYNSNGQLRSVILAKFDMDHHLKSIRFFGEEIDMGPAPIRTEVRNEDIYFSYMSCVGQNNHLVLICLDKDLNVRWETRLLNEDRFHWGTCMRILCDKKIAIGSFGYGINPGSISVVIVHDDYDNAVEHQGITIRPYLFYPNPAQNELHLQYSPDMKPKEIELYDLQGRLVRSQSNGLESISLQGLSAGQYLMKVTLENGKVFTDKVVKE